MVRLTIKKVNNFKIKILILIFLKKRDFLQNYLLRDFNGMIRLLLVST